METFDVVIDIVTGTDKYLFTLSRAVQYLKAPQRATRFDLHAQFSILCSRRIRTCGALALRFSSSGSPRRAWLRLLDAPSTRRHLRRRDQPPRPLWGTPVLSRAVYCCGRGATSRCASARCVLRGFVLKTKWIDETTYKANCACLFTYGGGHLRNPTAFRSDVN
eukprot:6188020-Pleurochrysis_carterae.AAC.1